MCTIVCVLSDWLTVFRLHHAFGGHENQSRGREVGSRDKEARKQGHLDWAEVTYTSVRSRLGYLQPHAQSTACSLLGCIAYHLLTVHPGSAGMEKLNNLWCEKRSVTYRVFVLPVIHSRLLPHHMQEIRDLCGHFSKERLPGGEPTPQTCWTFAL